MSRYIDIEPYEKDGWYLQKRYHNSYGEVIKTTPLVSVPTAEAVSKEDYMALRVASQMAFDNLRAEIERLKADSEPVKHGRWIKRGDNSWECSVCHEISCCNGNYCVDCGARMEEVEE